ncbi:MAG TPA: glycosyltransferase [Bacillales bacterium]|nr:glycosyltransferase [Bacillales bacterium]
MEGISVITCTMRPGQIDAILNNYSRQRMHEKELIVVLNNDEIDLTEWKQRAAAYPQVSVYKLPEKTTLGHCLNFAVRKTNHAVLAKMDDDDYYAPNYLRQAMEALERTGAAIVGKMSVVTYFEGYDLLAIRKPGHEHEFLEDVDFGKTHVGGGTMVWRKNRSLGFRNFNLGEDVVFQKECMRKRFPIYSTDMKNYVSIRRTDKSSHTWQGQDEPILNECKLIGRGIDYKTYVEG